MIRDLWHTNQKILRKTNGVVWNNRLLFLIGIPYIMILFIAMRLVFVVGIFAGLLMLLIQSAILSDYLHILNRTVKYGKFTVQDFRTGFRVYFRKVYITLLMIRVAYLGVDIFFDFLPMVRVYIVMVLNVGFFVFLNPLLEIIYLKHLPEWDGFKYALHFIMDNWIDWFIPNGLLFGILYSFNYLIGAFVNQLPWVNPWVSIVLTGILFGLLGQALISYGMVYRAFLFDLLSKTTRRKRLFMRHLN